MELPRARARSDAGEEAPPAWSGARVALAHAALQLTVVEAILESTLGRATFWGSHFYGFWPRGWMLAALPALALAAPPLPRFQRPAPEGPGAPPSAPRPGRRGDPASASPADGPPRTARDSWLPWAAGLGAGLLFWLLRERHTFWGDGMALVVNIPRGQAFHPDEPLSLYLHHLLYRLAGGRGSAVVPLALGSVLSGALFAGWTVHWFSRRRAAGGVWPLAAAALLLQGFTQIFYGHVENYSYLAVCLLIFFTSGVDALEGRGGVALPLFAATAAFAFHILGALTALPAAMLVAIGMRDRERRGGTLLALAIVAAVLALGLWSTSRLYGLESPWSRVLGGIQKVLTNPTDMKPVNALSGRHAADVWSEFMILGPLSAPLLALLLILLPGGRFLRAPAGAFLGLGAAVFFVPSLLTGAGNLGAARNWDLFAAPSVAPALCGILLVTDRLGGSEKRRLLLGLVAVSLFHTVPWVALNADLDRTVERIAALPLGQARGETLLGTYHLNRGELGQAERWFRLAVVRAPGNPSAESGLGLALARQGRLGAALPAMTEAVRLKPESVEMRYDLVNLLLSLERWEAAAHQLEAVVGLDSRDREAWLGLADLRMRLGQPDTAAFVAETALRHYPDDAELLRTLADAQALRVVKYQGQGDEPRARDALALFEATFPADPRIRSLREALEGRPRPAARRR